MGRLLGIARSKSWVIVPAVHRLDCDAMSTIGERIVSGASLPSAPAMLDSVARHFAPPPVIEPVLDRSRGAA
jgi:hypothetical protein